MTQLPLVPGAYERNTLTHRQPGSMGGPVAGWVDVPVGPILMDAATSDDRKREGGTPKSKLDRRST
jgi:hypothetical protein